MIIQEQIFSVECGPWCEYVPWCSCFRAIQFQITESRRGKRLGENCPGAECHSKPKNSESLLAKSKIKSQDVDKNKKAEKEKATAGEVRKQAMADIKKRENPDDECGMQMERKS